MAKIIKNDGEFAFRHDEVADDVNFRNRLIKEFLELNGIWIESTTLNIVDDSLYEFDIWPATAIRIPQSPKVSYAVEFCGDYDALLHLAATLGVHNLNWRP